MTSILKVDTLQDSGGNTILSSNGTGTFTSNLPDNTPAFQAYLSADQTVTSAVWTKVALNTKSFDTNNCYDNTTNYRFTPTVAGKYYIYGVVMGFAGTSTLELMGSEIYKNGSTVQSNVNNFSNSYIHTAFNTIYKIIEMNGSTDYVELYGRVFGGTTILSQGTLFGAYKIIGA